MSANDDGSVTTTTVTEVSGEGIKEISVAESNTDAAGTTVQVEETIAVVEAPKAATNGWGQNSKAQTQAPSAVAGAKKAHQPGVKLSWAQIARCVHRGHHSCPVLHGILTFILSPLHQTTFT